MKLIDADAVAAATPFPALIAALASAFAGRGACHAPPRGHHGVARGGEPERTLLTMPSWGDDGGVVVKLVNVVPANAARGLPAVQAVVAVADPETGAWTTLIDGGALTARRTAAASALAASHLAAEDARTMAMIGTGRLARPLIEAMATVRPMIRAVRIWGRDAGRAEALAAWAAGAGFAASVHDCEAAVSAADIVSCATLSRAPLVRGIWLKPGTHLDLVGAFRPDMRETDAEAVRRSAVFVDTREGALREGGDLVQAAAEGAFDPVAVQGDLAELCSGAHPGRCGAGQITLFKSVGASIEDYAAARLVLSRT